MPCTNAFGAQMAWQASAGLVLSCSDGGLYRVSPGQTIARVLTTSGRDAPTGLRPSLLPNGRGLLFTRRVADPAAEVTMVQTFDNREPRVVTSGRGPTRQDLSCSHAVRGYMPNRLTQPVSNRPSRPGRWAFLSPGKRHDALFPSMMPALCWSSPGPSRITCEFASSRASGRPGATVGPDGNYGGSTSRSWRSRRGEWRLRPPPGLLVFGDKLALKKRLTLVIGSNGDPNIVAVRSSSRGEVVRAPACIRFRSTAARSDSSGTPPSSRWTM